MGPVDPPPENSNKSLEYESVDEVSPTSSPMVVKMNLYFKFLALILSVVASPFIAHCITGQVEKLRIEFEKEDRERKREYEVRLQHRKMRNTLVKEVLEICKTADLDNIAHAYRLGWIAEIVEANPKIFNLDMKKAKEKLDKIIEKIALMDNVRKRLLESEKSEAGLQSKVKKYDKDNVNLEKQLRRARKGLEKVQWKGYKAKKKWNDKISGLEKRLNHSQFRRRMYGSWLRRERMRRRMYAFQLNHTKRELKRKMQNAASQKKSDNLKISKLNTALAGLQRKSQMTTKEYSNVKSLVRKLTAANTKAQTTVSDLKDEVKKLKATNLVLVKERKALFHRVSDCKLKVVMGAQ